MYVCSPVWIYRWLLNSKPRDLFFSNCIGVSEPEYLHFDWLIFLGGKISLSKLDKVRKRIHISKIGTRIRYIYRLFQWLLLSFLVLFDHNSKREFSLSECFCLSSPSGMKLDIIWPISWLEICSGNWKLTFLLWKHKMKWNIRSDILLKIRNSLYQWLNS